MLFVYAAIIVAMAVVVAVSARDVIFERFTYRVGATVVSDGERVFVIGGRSDEGSRYREILTIDPRTETIGRAKGLGIDLSGSAAAASDGQLFICGGSRTTGYVDTIYRFDAQSKKLTEMGTLPFPVAYASAAVVDGALYIAGGFDGVARRDDIVRIDLATGDANVVAHLPGARDGHIAVAYESTMLVAGGNDPGGNPSDELWQIDPATGRLIESIQLPFEPRSASMTVVGSNLVLLGATHGSNRQLVVDLSRNSIVSDRVSDLNARIITITSANGQAMGIGDAHPSARRQLGVWYFEPGERTVVAKRFHSRIWH